MPYVDDFSRQAREYARHRPRYPDAVFDYLASLAPTHNLALDVGTGSGQAAVSLARHFAAVVGLDASASQLAYATPDPRVSYRVGRAEATGLADGSVDLVTVAQAMHWFDLDDFYGEVKRILRPGGVLAAWAYALITTDNPALDEIFARFWGDIVGPYWSPGAQLVAERYKTLPFPFAEIIPPPFNLTVDWDLDDLIGYFLSWSGRQRFMEVRGYDPLDDIRADLLVAWGDPAQRRPIIWPLDFRIGRVE